MHDAPLPNTFGIDARARRLIGVRDVDALPAAERQESFREMMEIALAIA